MPEPYDVHTCHADCPCQHGGEPPRDFIPAEGSLLPGLFAMARLRQRRAAPSDDAAPTDTAPANHEGPPTRAPDDPTSAAPTMTKQEDSA